VVAALAPQVEALIARVAAAGGETAYSP